MKKRSFIALLLVVFLLFFTGCEPHWEYLSKERVEDVVEIQLIYYRNPEALEIGKQDTRTIPFDFEKMEIIEIMSEEKAEVFLYNLDGHSFWHDHEPHDSPNGYSLRLLFGNGDFMILSFDICHYSAIFDKDGNLIEFYGQSMFDTDGWGGVNSFFSTTIVSESSD